MAAVVIFSHDHATAVRPCGTTTGTDTPDDQRVRFRTELMLRRDVVECGFDARMLELDDRVAAFANEVFVPRVAVIVVE